MIDQLTVFLENSKGRLTALCRTLGDADINMFALSVADTSEFGIVRIVCDDPASAVKALNEKGFHATTTSVVAVAVPHRPGGLADVLSSLDAVDLNIEYAYCFLDVGNNTTTVAMKTDEAAISVLEKAGFEIVHQFDLAK